MKKADAEPEIRRLFRVWKDECFPDTDRNDLRFSDFKAWLLVRSPVLLDFRSTMGAPEDAEQWFDEDFGQTWRN